MRKACCVHSKALGRLPCWLQTRCHAPGHAHRGPTQLNLRDVAMLRCTVPQRTCGSEVFVCGGCSPAARGLWGTALDQLVFSVRWLSGGWRCWCFWGCVVCEARHLQLLAHNTSSSFAPQNPLKFIVLCSCCSWTRVREIRWT